MARRPRFERADASLPKESLKRLARVLTAEVIPATNKQTATSRRKRFAHELERILAPYGWRREWRGSHLIFVSGTCKLP
jgi:hypothetical protein